MGDITVLGALWFVVTFITGAVMWAAQIGPKAAVSNLAQWVEWFHIKPPGWLKSPRADRIVRRVGWLLLAILFVIGLWLFQSQQVALGAACAELVLFSLVALRRRTRTVAIALTIVSFLALGVGVGILVFEKTQHEAAPSAGTPQAQAATQVTVEAVKIPAPYYNRADIDNLLDATREISALLQAAIPVREAGLTFDRTWNDIIRDQGEGAARVKLKEVRVGLKSIAEQGWAISNKYTHYNDQIGPILGGMNFSERAEHGIDRFNRAIEKLRPDADQGTISLLEAVRPDYQTGLVLFQQWISETHDKNRAATEKFRHMKQAEK